MPGAIDRIMLVNPATSFADSPWKVRRELPEAHRNSTAPRWDLDGFVTGADTSSVLVNLCTAGNVSSGRHKPRQMTPEFAQVLGNALTALPSPIYNALPIALSPLLANPIAMAMHGVNPDAPLIRQVRPCLDMWAGSSAIFSCMASAPA